LLKFGEPNLLEVTVSKESANTSVNRAERMGITGTLAASSDLFISKSYLQLSLTGPRLMLERMVNLH
jgi:hypothetical protein